jgi:predicted CXXCH cytochrome family protein
MRRDLNLKIIILFVFIFFAAGRVIVIGDIANSAHDFSNYGWSNGEICLPCHTPHNADVTELNAPLWNHEVTEAAFITYDSPTMKVTPLTPRGPSKLCLSCHDGTVAVDSFGGATGANYVSGPLLIGADLSNDHPISVYWSHQNTLTNGTCIECHNPSPTDFNPILPLFDRYIECSTCHDPHNKSGNVKLLRKPLAGSEICFHCHGK